MANLSAAALLRAPYLADLVRFAAARRRSLRAPDVPPIAPEALASIPVCAWEDVRAVLRPSVQVVASRWPILSLWEGRASGSELPGLGEEVLLVRRADAVAMHLLPTGGAAFVSALRGRATFAQARAAGLEVPGFDLVEVLALLFSTQAIAALERR
jgi:hypothetical protein